MPAHHLVVGGGPVGRHVASILIERGERVVIGSRSGRNTGVQGATYIPLDAADAEALTRAAEEQAATSARRILATTPSGRSNGRRWPRHCSQRPSGPARCTP
jgi:nucleoside-diphosphate-sugar epimerase